MRGAISFSGEAVSPGRCASAVDQIFKEVVLNSKPVIIPLHVSPEYRAVLLRHPIYRRRHDFDLCVEARALPAGTASGDRSRGGHGDLDSA